MDFFSLFLLTLVGEIDKEKTPTTTGNIINHYRKNRKKFGLWAEKKSIRFCKVIGRPNEL